MSSELIGRIKDYIRRNNVALQYAPVPNEQAILRAEAKLSFTLPPLLKECYQQIANGGFGPGLGIIGIEGGYKSDFGDLVETYDFFRTDEAAHGGAWQERLLPFCEWGCATFSCVQSDTLNVSTFEEGRLWPPSCTLDQFFDMWIKSIDILSHDPGVEVVDLEFVNPFTKRKQTIKQRRRHES